jgi:outer membrane protein assembly factor BamB
VEPLSADDPRAVGEFSLRARLGAGGMGQVFLGFSPSGRAVAVKVIHADLADNQEFLSRFRHEVAAAQAVSGIYTAPVVAVGMQDRPPWLATAFVPGPTLSEVIKAYGPMPEAALWRLAAGLAEALQAVHARGIVHRDLKPGNVLLAADGPRVIDFGIAQAAMGTALTSTGIIGTPGFMSPEQAEGVRVGPASDVFSLGCVLTYAATGSHPFGSGSPASVVFRVVHAQPALDPVPAALRGILAGCLAKNPDERPTLPALAAAVSSGGSDTGSLGGAFWPVSVAGLIRRHQAQLDAIISRPAGAGPAPLPGPASALAQPGPAPLPPGPGPLPPRPGPLSPAMQPRLASPYPAAAPGRPATPPPGAAPGYPGAAPGRPATPPPGAAPGYPGAGPGRPATPAPSPVPGYPGRPPAQPPGMRPVVPPQGPPMGSLPGAHRTAPQGPGQAAGASTGHSTGRRAVLAGLGVAVGAVLGVTGWKLSERGGSGRGQEVWRFTAQDRISGSPAVGSGAVYFGSDDQNIYAVDTSTGKKLWSYTTGGPVSSTPAVASGLVYVGSSDQKVYALRASSGTVAWQLALDGPVQCQMVVADGMVYAISVGGTLSQIDAASGKLHEQVDTGSSSPTPAAAIGGSLYIGNANGGLFAYELPTEQQSWHFAAPSGRAVSAGPLVSDGTVLIVCQDNTLYAVGTANGDKLWSRSGIPVGTSYLAADGSLAYAYSTVRGLYALTALDTRTGAVRWTSEGGGSIQLIEPAISGGIVYAGGNGSMTGYQARTGSTAWEFNFDGLCPAGPAIADGTLYFGDGEGQHMYAVRV